MYAFELLKAIQLLQDEWQSSMRFVIFLKDQPLADMPKPTESFSYQVIPGGGMWIIKTLMPALFKMKAKPDVFFTPSHYVPPIAPMPRVCSIMDLGYLEFSGQFRAYDYWQLNLWSAWSMIVSKCIIAISDTTKKDIVRHYKFTSKKIATTLLAYDKSLFHERIPESDVRRIKKTYTDGRNYILFLSTLKPSKNIEGLITAWSMIESQLPDTDLVIAGKKGWLYDSIFELTKRLNMQNRVVFTDFIPESEKPALIAGARAFVLPSFWEGFGLDVLNAMAAGVPVVVSDRGSLPEVVGNAGTVINPDSYKEIADAIAHILTLSKKDYNTLASKGVKRAKTFSWEKTARETLAILQKVGTKK